MPDAEPRPCQVRFFRIKGSQAIRIPIEFELPGTQAVISRDGDRIIIEPVLPSKLLDLLADWIPLDDEFPDVAEGLPPLRDVSL